MSWIAGVEYHFIQQHASRALCTLCRRAIYLNPPRIRISCPRLWMPWFTGLLRAGRGNLPQRGPSNSVCRVIRTRRDLTEVPDPWDRCVARAIQMSISVDETDVNRKFLSLAMEGRERITMRDRLYKLQVESQLVIPYQLVVILAVSVHSRCYYVEKLIAMLLGLPSIIPLLLTYRTN